VELQELADYRLLVAVVRVVLLQDQANLVLVLQVLAQGLLFPHFLVVHTYTVLVALVALLAKKVAQEQ
jgi:hypothetical protein